MKLSIEWHDENEEPKKGEDFPGEAEENDEEFTQLLEQEGNGKARTFFRVGERVRATIVHISETSDNVTLECGGKESVVSTKQDLASEGETFSYKIGDLIDAYVVSKTQGEIFLSNSLTHSIARDKSLETAYYNQVPVKGKVSGVNKGGFEVTLMGKKAFCPISQIDNSFVKDPAVFLNKEFEFLVTKLFGRDIVVSRSALLQLQAQDKLEILLKKIDEGPIVSGVVKEIRPFGAFLEFDGIIGLIHLSEMAYKHVTDASEIVSVGDRLKAKVLRIENQGSGAPKISLSIKALIQDPWETITQDFTVDQSLQGQVVRLTDFGAFIELKPGIEGLIHLSEMSWTKRVHHPKDVLTVGDRVEVRIKEIDPMRRRISLTMKAITEDPWHKAEERFPAGSTFLAPVERLKNFGALITLAEGVSALLPISVLKLGFGESYRKKATPGMQLQVKVVKTEPYSRKILLTLENLGKDDEMEKDFQEYLDSLNKDKEISITDTKSSTGSFGELLQKSMKK